MSIEKSHDPRTVLVRTKYFSLHPKPLERWLWQQGLPQAAERVFWLHWEEGMRSGDWCSEIPIRRVARECAVDPSTVTRAYQVLKSRGLIRREDPGRDPLNPFQQATAITEVRLPRELVIELARSPNRPQTGRGGSATGASPQEARTVRPPATHDTPQATTADPVSIQRPTRQQTQAMWARASEGERARFFTATRDRLTTFEFDPGSRLTAEDRAQILALMAQQATARPTVPVCSQPTPKVGRTEPMGPRRLSTLDRARARRSVLERLPATSGSVEVLRQVLWAMEEGALRKFAVPLALNIALKKIREGAWTKPHRIPPNWMLTGTGMRAVAEQCSAA